MERESLLRAGQVWCWGSSMHMTGGDRLWLLTEVFPMSRHEDKVDMRDAMAVNLETGELRRVNNLPAYNHPTDAKFMDIKDVTWRRVA